MHPEVTISFSLAIGSDYLIMLLSISGLGITLDLTSHPTNLRVRVGVRVRVQVR